MLKLTRTSPLPAHLQMQFAIAQMPNDAAAEKAGSAEHGDGATVRCHHDSNSPVYVGASHCLGRGTHPGDRATIRHHEVFHRQRCGGPPAVNY
jgi:hypothetical protein